MFSTNKGFQILKTHMGIMARTHARGKTLATFDRLDFRVCILLEQNVVTVDNLASQICHSSKLDN
jgi:hypothetical protein